MYHESLVASIGTYIIRRGQLIKIWFIVRIKERITVKIETQKKVVHFSLAVKLYAAKF